MNKTKTQSNPIETEWKCTLHKGKPHHNTIDQEMNNEQWTQEGNIPYFKEEEEVKKWFPFQEMNEDGEDWTFQEMNEYDEDFAIVVVWFARVCVMKEIKNLLCFNFAGNNFTMVANTKLRWNIIHMTIIDKNNRS